MQAVQSLQPDKRAHPCRQARMSGDCPLDTPALSVCLPGELSHMSLSRARLPCSAQQRVERLKPHQVTCLKFDSRVG